MTGIEKDLPSAIKTQQKQHGFILKLMKTFAFYRKRTLN